MEPSQGSQWGLVPFNQLLRCDSCLQWVPLASSSPHTSMHTLLSCHYQTAETYNVCWCDVMLDWSNDSLHALVCNLWKNANTILLKTQVPVIVIHYYKIQTAHEMQVKQKLILGFVSHKIWQSDTSGQRRWTRTHNSLIFLTNVV